MSRRDLAAILDVYVGNGRPVPADGKPHEFSLAEEIHVSGRTVYRLIDPEDHAELDRLQLIALFKSERLPLEMRKEIADTLFRESRQMRVVLTDEKAAEPTRPVLRITTEIDRTICELEEAFHEIVCPRSAGGDGITAAEGAQVDPKVSRIEALLTELKRSINDRRLKAAV